MEKQTESLLPGDLKLYFSSETRPNSLEEKKVFYKCLDIASSLENLSLLDKMRLFNELYLKNHLLLGSDKKDPTIQETNSFELSNAFLNNDRGRNLSKFLEENDLSLCTGDFSMYSKNEILESYEIEFRF